MNYHDEEPEAQSAIPTKHPANTPTTVARVFRKLTRSGRRTADQIRQILLADGQNHAVEALRKLLYGVPGDLCMSDLFFNRFTTFFVGDRAYVCPLTVTKALSDWYATICK